MPLRHSNIRNSEAGSPLSGLPADALEDAARRAGPAIDPDGNTSAGAALNRREIERWENEGGEVPDVTVPPPRNRAREPD